MCCSNSKFDELIGFLQTNPVWAQKLYSAKERFIRSKDRNYYSTDFFGFYDESEKQGRSQFDLPDSVIKFFTRHNLLDISYMICPIPCLARKALNS